VKRPSSLAGFPLLTCNMLWIGQWIGIALITKIPRQRSPLPQPRFRNTWRVSDEPNSIRHRYRSHGIYRLCAGGPEIKGGDQSHLPSSLEKEIVSASRRKRLAGDRNAVVRPFRTAIKTRGSTRRYRVPSGLLRGQAGRARSSATRRR